MVEKRKKSIKKIKIRKVRNEVSETQVLMEQLSLLAQDRQAYRNTDNDYRYIYIYIYIYIYSMW